MEPTLIASAVMIFLKPYLEKAGEKVAETIGEKFAEKATERNIWERIKSLFIKEGDIKDIKEIEGKEIADTKDVTLIESKLTNALKEDPQLTRILKAELNLSSVNTYVAEQILLSIKKDKEDLARYYQEKRLASIETEGSYEIMIIRTRRRIEKDEREIINLIVNK